MLEGRSANRRRRTEAGRAAWAVMKAKAAQGQAEAHAEALKAKRAADAQKREDLAHTGAHKINNALGQVLIAKRMGKHKHTPEQYGIDVAEVRARMTEYYDRFGHLLERPS